MKEIFAFFVFTLLLLVSSKPLAQDLNPANTLSTEEFGWKDIDTVYYEKDNTRTIHKIINNGKVSEFYSSGNLKATGYVVKKSCTKIYDSTLSNVLYESCDFSLEGEWNVYYDSTYMLKAAVINFKDNNPVSRNLISVNGCICQKELVDRKLIQIEKYDENCQLAQKELIFPFQGDRYILRVIKFENGKVIAEEKVPAVTVFVAKYYDIIGGILLFFALIKFVLCIFYFDDFYRNHITVNGNWRSFLVNFRGTFTLYIRSYPDDENYFMAKVHNYASIITLILGVFFFYNLSIM